MTDLAAIRDCIRQCAKSRDGRTHWALHPAWRVEFKPSAFSAWRVDSYQWKLCEAVIRRDVVRRLAIKTRICAHLEPGNFVAMAATWAQS
ncbi:MAG: hypothetical protein RLZZ373_2636 [Pseudomonadota bacterium]|jgi:hypothetical protein